MQSKEVKLLYGKNGITLNIQDDWNANIIRKPLMPIIDDISGEVNKALNNPINSLSIDKISSKGKSVCILVCDITRPVPNKLFLKQIIIKFINAGISADNILIIIATGLHRPASQDEINEIIGSSWVLKNIKIENHFARDDSMHKNIGTTKQGNIVKLDKRFVDADIKIATGLVEPHFMAGYSGGRKVIAPGIAHADTITTFHSARYMENPNATSCNLINNPLHEDQLEIVNMIGQVYAINCVIDEERNLSYINFGEIISSHMKAVNFVSSFAKVKCNNSYNTIITSAAGAPLDGTFYQTVKGMVTPLEILKKGGDLIITSECSEGLGSEEFIASQKKLLEIGPNKFLENILKKDFAAIDEWQTEMEIKSLIKGNIFLFSEGLSEKDKLYTGVNIINNIAKTIDESIKRHNNNNIAIIPEGPYVIPAI
ncbi:MAG: nickel-dependent lactate racemase [Alphaproteobacteria bacterium]|nr:MAG: nickel-dependent lactate racemase [Alphaproteobacteria bacterium]|tara:strand:+ start:560 stop:1843 length:1284 start_codon:yes stop_codon:yes gene_type:complete